MSKFQGFRRRWFKPYRLVLHEEQSYLERWQITINRLGFATTLASLLLFISAATYALVGWTPLRELVIPGYASESSRQRAIQAELRADSAIQALEVQEKYLAALSTILRGEVPVDNITEAALDSAALANSAEELDDWGLTDEDLELRARVEDEDRFALQRAQSGERSTKGIPFPPLQGEVSSKFDPAIGHYGVDFVAPIGSVIHAVDDGAVTLASYTSDGGYVISIQHPGSRTSVYKHNKSLLVEVGDRVQVGDPIAILGGTGTHSTGPHSHFEWWVDGQPLDPVEWLPEYVQNTTEGAEN
jgi:murein DD-endopeptidase MepM/ murein hydrolase activator NlpD